MSSMETTLLMLTTVRGVFAAMEKPISVSRRLTVQLFNQLPPPVLMREKPTIMETVFWLVCVYVTVFVFFFFQATATLSRKKCPEKIVHVAVLSLKVNHTHCNLSAGKKPAWCKRFYVKDYGRKKKWLGQNLNSLPLVCNLVCNYTFMINGPC